MPGTEKNLLIALHKFAERQDENFTTEGFAHLVRHLLQNDPAVGVNLLAFLTQARLGVRVDNAKSVDVQTQVATDSGRPDMQIGTADHLVYVEVKLGSDVSPDQLGRYRRELDSSGFLNTTLVLLTRYPPEIEPVARVPDVSRRWYGVAEHLRGALAHCAADSTSAFLIRQFLDFLQERGMTMEQVTWELKAGVKALENLMAMLDEVLEGRVPEHKISVGKEWAGYNIEGKKAWIGIHWADPTILTFHTWEVDIDSRVAEELGYGDTEKRGGRLRWSVKLDLESEEEHFFARSRRSQMRRIEEFVDHSLAALKKLESGEKK